MKRSAISRLLAPALLAVGATVSALAQTSVTTDPVGFVSVSLPATGYTYVGVSLVTPTVVSSSNTTLSGAVVTVGVDLDTILDVNKPYYMEIANGTYEGYQADVQSWSGVSLTLKEDIESGGVSPAQFNGSRLCIRELPTIGTVFGANNSAGLKPGTLATADLIYLYGESGFSRYYYFPGGFGQSAEWRNEAGGPAAATAIHYGDGLVIQTRDTSGKQITITGSVKLGPTNVPIYPGYNLLSNPNPIEDQLTLASSGLKDGLQAGTAATGDLVYIASPSGGFDKYYYFPGGFGQPAGWKNVATGQYSDSVPLPDSGSFFVERRSGETSVLITETLPNP